MPPKWLVMPANEKSERQVESESAVWGCSAISSNERVVSESCALQQSVLPRISTIGGRKQEFRTPLRAD
jgi:hypothetical protein